MIKVDEYRQITLREIEVGDKIEITTPVGAVFSDFVVGILNSGTHLHFRNGFVICEEDTYTYRLLYRPLKFTVGSVISGKNVFELPFGSHVRRVGSARIPDNTWIVIRQDSKVKVIRANHYNYNHTVLKGDYVVDYIPEWSNND